MKTLELKHLSAYLPYNIEIEHPTMFSGKKEISELRSLNERSVEIEHRMYVEISSCKPLLRPLSQLTQEIDYNEERFVPMDRIKRMYPSDTFSSTSNIAQWSYRIVEKLLSWHFDLFGLLENNLAIEKS
jgi:hypothetical protein